MGYETESIDALIDEIKGTTRHITGIFSSRVNFIFAAIILGALVAINFLIR
jgi:hypothetical protein